MLYLIDSSSSTFFEPVISFAVLRKSYFWIYYFETGIVFFDVVGQGRDEQGLSSSQKKIIEIQRRRNTTS
ncbi:hypothetical protein Bca101_056812 [Brassica carinata]